MEKFKFLYLAAISGCLLFSCDSRRQESGAVTGANTGMMDNDDRKDPVEIAEEANDAKFDNTENADLKEDHAEFLVEAASGGMFEVEAAKIAQEKATNPKVKNFAKHMVDEHSKANKELKALAAKKNVTLPDAVGEDEREKIQKLSQVSAAEFDKKYMEMMVKAHKEDVSEFDSQSKGSDDTEVEKWAANTLPKLQKHLEMAQQLQDEIEKSNNNSARR